jgi:alpha-beta hydrolase superfamily lysophospholipase
MSLATPHQFQFASADGLQITCARWNNRHPPRGVIQIAHGMGEHIGRYQNIIEELVHAGVVVYGNDHREKSAATRLAVSQMAAVVAAHPVFYLFHAERFGAAEKIHHQERAQCLL